MIQSTKENYLTFYLKYILGSLKKKKNITHYF